MIKEAEIEISARHIHFAARDYYLLFSDEPKKMKELSQKGEFSTDKKVTIVGDKDSVEARVLLPFRDQTQVELALTDCYKIGTIAPYDTEVDARSAKITIKGELGEIDRDALMVAKRHLHCSPTEASDLKIKDGDKIAAEIETDRGKVLLYDIEVKVESDFRLRLHLDTDEGNACGIKGTQYAKIMQSEERKN